jgi:hypothetical protein
MTVDDLMTDIPLTQGAMDSSNVRLDELTLYAWCNL